MAIGGDHGGREPAGMVPARIIQVDELPVTHNGKRSEAAARAASACDQALAVFDIEPPFTVVRLKARYKVLVKLHHPDAHGGDKAAEERLKIINQAYATLKASYFS